ncbi:MAG: response regulator [Propionibacteriaceae bacterium]|jgi:DNA-binding response OmpR family regulator|nr:response regulator [Propionibacteriaceae bacterium]
METVVLVYSDDRSVRSDVRDALGTTLGGENLVIREAATQAAVLMELDGGDIDCCVFDAEATPAGGMGLCKQIHDEYEACPPVVLLIARAADSWLAAWSLAEAVQSFPVDPLTFPKVVEDLVFVEVDEVAEAA